MHNPIVVAILLLIGLILLFYLMRALFAWLKDFFDKTIGFSKYLLIIVAIAIVYCTWRYPQETQWYALVL